VPISDTPIKDPVVVGTFYFKKAKTFFEAARAMIEKGIRVNGEFYVDTVINEVIASGAKVKAFEVDRYLCWGTPDELMTYTYWQRFFDSEGFHPYSILEDEDVS
jgi:hypothetical protein